MDLAGLSGALGVISDVVPILSCIDSHPNGQTWTSLLKHEIIGCLYPAGNKTIQPQLEPFSSKVDAFVPHLTEQKLTPIHDTDPIQLTQPTALEHIHFAMLFRLLLCTYVFKLLHAGNQETQLFVFFIRTMLVRMNVTQFSGNISHFWNKRNTIFNLTTQNVKVNRKNFNRKSPNASGVFVADLKTSAAQMLETDTNMNASLQRFTYKCLHNIVTNLAYNRYPRVLSVHFAFSINEP